MTQSHYAQKNFSVLLFFVLIPYLSKSFDIYSLKHCSLVKSTMIHYYHHRIPDTIPISNYNFYYKEINKYFTIYVVNTETHDLKIHNNANAGMTIYGIYNKLKKNGNEPIALMNAGMFMVDYSPVGLLVSEEEKRPIINNLNELSGFGNFYMKPNGVFCIDKNNNSYILQTSEFKKSKKLYAGGKYNFIRYATQSGPMLIINGKINSIFSLKSNNLNIRNGIGISKQFKNRIFLVKSNQLISFYEFAYFFKNILKCDNALYLDGGISKLFITLNNNKSKLLIDNRQLLGPIISVTKK